MFLGKSSLRFKGFPFRDWAKFPVSLGCVVYLVSIFPVGSVSRLGELHDKQQNIGKGSFVKISRLHRFPDYKYRFRDCFGFQVRCWIPRYQLAVTSRLLSSGQEHGAALQVAIRERQGASGSSSPGTAHSHF